jgi:phosphoribosylglycinamide formyltransferase-1
LKSGREACPRFLSYHKITGEITMLSIAVFISGGGTDLQSIIDAIEAGRVSARIAVVISNEPDAFGLVRAAKHGIPTAVINHQDYKSRHEFEEAILAVLKDFTIELICLAGFMRVLTPEFLRRFPHRVINIHPALLPAFPGTHGQADAFTYGVKFSGCTIHFVDEGVDTGPIIMQAVVPVLPDDDVESLKARILAQEHKIYPQVIHFFAEGRVTVVGKKVVIKGAEAVEGFSHTNPPLEIFR